MNINIDELGILNQETNIYIKDIKYYLKKSLIIIELYGTKIINADLFDEIENKMIAFLDITDDYKVKFIYTAENKNIDNNQTVIQYYHKILKDNPDLNNMLNGINIEIENDILIFDLNFKYQQKIVDNIAPKILMELENYGFSKFKISYHLLNEIEKKEIIANKLEAAEKKILNENIKTNKEIKNKHLFGELGSKTFPIDKILDPDIGLKNITIEGFVFNKELRDLKKSSLLTIMVKDDTGTIICKAFTGFNNKPPTYMQLNRIKEGMLLKISGKKMYDRYLNDEIIEISGITIIEEEPGISKRSDEEEEKRVELHVHSKMSKNNGVSSMEDYVNMAKHFGHKAIAVTDHDGVQGYVDAYYAGKKNDIKIIYGIESSIVEKPKVVRNANNEILEDTVYTVFDLETTGLSANFNKIIEIGAVKIKKEEVIGRFQMFIKIDENLSEFTTELTGITNENLQNGYELKDALKKFKEFYQNTVLVAHNATFDYQFLNKNEMDILNEEVNVPVLDTLELSRILNPENTFHSLKILSRKYGVPMDNDSHHRADYDSEKLAEIFILMLKQIQSDFNELNNFNSLNETGVNKSRGSHELIYVKNQKGLRDLYELISNANTDDYLMEPRIKLDNLNDLKENLIISGSGCVKSRLIDYYLNKTQLELEKLIEWYDCIDLNPIPQYDELISNGTFKSVEDVKKMHKEIILIAKKSNTLVFASSNAHFIEPDMYITKEILISKDLKPEKLKMNKITGVKDSIDKIRFEKIRSEKKSKYKNQFFHTTEEMLEEFDFLEQDLAQEIVITNTNKITDMVDELKIIPDDLYTPEIDGVDDKLKNMVYEKAKDIYSEKLPDVVEKRIEKELNSIIKYGFSVIYYISHKLVKYSLDNGYLVGSRGSVGSSLVATLMDITEINPLPPHYICAKCQHVEFFLDGEYASGFDLPHKNCPKCNENLIKEGQDIPFETFLGFAGDKVPDIDLNFSGEFQAQAHDYVRSKNKLNDDELFDENHAFRAGTIGTIAEKTAYVYTKNYFDLQSKPVRKSDILYHSKNCVGIKRTTGQHPGGIIVVPTHRQIYEFTAVQYPADDKKQPWRTTHFDFHSIHDNLLKLDILGHDDPTMLKRLYDLTGVDPKNVDVSDEKILQLFTGVESIGLEADEYFTLGTQGIPEFGTDFVMGMLKDTKPTTFSELVQISGLSHGTDVWLGNAKDLIDQKICVLKDVIGCRDDIMVYLMYQGIEPKQAFNIMENVRKGKGLTNEEINILKDNDIPDWYINSCQKIKYMFPKAHAAAYVLMALRIAYYKVYYPLEYYCAYFSSRVSDFEAIPMIKGEESLIQRIELLNNYEEELSEIKKKNLLNSLKMSLEMVKRGYSFIGFDIEKSDAFNFVIDYENNGLIMPFSIIDGLGEKEALIIVEERNKGQFKTKDDLKKRTKIKSKTIEQLEYFDVLEHLEDSNQLKLF